MTTAPGKTTATSGSPVLLWAGAATAISTVLVAGVAVVVSGASAGGGALVGGLIGVGVMAFGTLSLNLVASVMPGASLAIALLTYGLQIVLTATALVALTQSGLLETTLDRQWLGGTLIGAVLIWTVAHVRAASQARIPIYDLPERREPTTAEADAR